MFMLLTAIESAPSQRYSLDIIQEEARQLLQAQKISRHQPIYILCQYIPAREWVGVESELALADYLLRDSIGDLVNSESWHND